MSSVRIVIVNYRTADLTIDCLRSLVGEVAHLPDCRVVVVDNQSDDGSLERIDRTIRAEGWDWAEVRPAGGNRGFAGGNNTGLRPLLAEPKPADYFLLLNPDTVVRPGAVRVLAEFLDRHPRVGIVGSRLEGPDGTPQFSAMRFPSVQGEWERSVRLGPMTRWLRRWVLAPPVRPTAHRTDWVVGASMMVRREVFATAGLMDEDYFLYYEETDFCLQARRAGWSCWYVPQSRVVHLEGQSTGVTDPKRPPRRLPGYWFDSRQRYFRKNHGRLYASFADLAMVTGCLLWQLRRRVEGKPNTDPPRLLIDCVRHSLGPVFGGSQAVRAGQRGLR